MGRKSASPRVLGTTTPFHLNSKRNHILLNNIVFQLENEKHEKEREKKREKAEQKKEKKSQKIEKRRELYLGS